MNIVLVFQDLPWSTRVYYIPDAPAWLIECHGLYVNSGTMTPDQLKLMYRVMDATSGNPVPNMAENAELACKWKGFKLESAVPPGPVDAVVVCGWID